MWLPAGGVFPSRVARGSALRKMACPLARGSSGSTGFKAINSRTGQGQPGRCPFQRGSEMDAKRTRGLVLLAALSLFSATVAWAEDHAVFTSVFAALGTVAALGAAGPRHRR